MRRTIERTTLLLGLAALQAACLCACNASESPAGGSDAASSSGGGHGGATSSASSASTGGTGGASTSSTGTGGVGNSGGIDGGTVLLLFDMPMIADPSTAQCTFTNPHGAFKDGVALDVWNVSYVSWESVAGALKPIMIRGFAAKPSALSANLAGIVTAHGLGGMSHENDATGVAALTGAFVIAYTGPGGGDSPDNTSEGLPSGHMSGYRMFDTIPDTRGSWFWGHAVAGMRGITCLTTRPEVDAARLGFTGFSAGGVVTLIAAGVDDRVKAAVPLSASHAWSVAVQSPTAWQRPLLTLAGLDTSSPEWLKLQEDIIDPAATVAKSSAKVLMVNGTTDEFFPLTAHVATLDAIPGSDKRTSLAGNFDHGCYLISGVESASTIEDRASTRASGGQRMWFAHWFGTDPDFSYVPSPPVPQLQPAGAATLVTAVVDPGGPSLSVEEVKIWWSNDDSFVYGNVALDLVGNGVYGKLVAFPLQANTVTFVDVLYKTPNILAPKRFSISSRPEIPQGLVPHIRDVMTCL